ncbi:hypothetical protein GH714_043582 [Hevea brasiliensis]|uniref:1,3-beta-glucan synthase n=1 Tax=Hevea brasiliensis TaxID=3981 RepID=A0A6A6K346_HEVBR|nr:hypothetical protein GH714_043582 [Hevea brasiliensis]
MAMELNKILEDYIDENTGQPVMPSLSGENAFLNCVVKPIYETIKKEVESSKNGTAPHSAWRNYDDLNEYFWTKRCFAKLKWPIDVGSNFFVISSGRKHVGKTGFVEQRSFWNLLRSFDRLWVMLILFLQFAIIVAWERKEYPWQALEDREVQVRVLTLFFTWSGLRLLQSLLDAGMQYSLVSRETMWLGVRMLLKSAVAAGWIIVFGVFYGRIWSQKNSDGRWSSEANRRIVNFLEVALVFVLPELLALAFFIIPWIRNFLENRNWRIFYLLSWWFQSRSFVGRGLREGLVDNIKYTLFWVVVLATKFAFSYFLQIKPMIKPSRQLLDLRDVTYEWHEFSKAATVGLLAHLGEIRNIQQLTLRFQFFASAIQFNLMPEEQLLNARGTLKSKFKDAIHRLKLRYGLGRPYKKLESNQVEANKFALIWNEIITTFREEDIISDRELELLELPQNSWNVRVIRWPCFLLCNELLLALSQAKELVDAPDKWLWYKICKNEYRRCAVIEAYDSVKHLLLETIKINTEEHSIITVLFQEIDHSLQIEKFTKTFNMTALPHFHTKLIKLVELLNKPKKDLNQVVNTLQALYEIAVRDFFKDKRSTEQLREDGLAPHDPAAMAGLLFQNAVELPDASNETFYRQVRRLHTILTSRDSMQNIPKNLEARRRIAFFSNSLFMNMPHAPQVEKMMAFSVLTPYYNEEVLYSREQLRTENEDGISIWYYLQTIYNDEWKNFIERMRREGMVKEDELWTTRMRDLRLWASYRGQTLARTVRGMMYYYRALKMLAFLDSASEVDIREGSRELGSMRRDGGSDSFKSEGSPSFNSLSRNSSSVNLLFKGHEYGTALMKYSYVVACQIYGTQKAKKDPHAEEILYLMKTNEALRVAYVDEVNTGRDEKEYYSVLVKYDQQLDKEVEIYRIKLPGPLKLGEGKPENQNHALIFTRGDAVQTIDMNQDNYFEEALKMRNLLEEYRRYYGIRKPTILGVREHIFTGSVSSLAWFMSAQEMSFVTLGQRVLANPLKVRMHYGHPDVFDRFWFLTRGGISKASRVINISEDIFAGFNCTLRGGNVTHQEYIQVGKGRDVGFNQVSMFEAKVASGNGEQHKGFAENYRLYARSHFVKAIELGLILTVYASHSAIAKDTFVYIAMTIFSWFLVVSWIMAPFVFNPSGFDWLKTVYDFDDFMNWIWYKGGVFAKAEQSWERWWCEEQEHLRTTGLWGKLLEIVLDLRFFFFQYGIVYQLGIADNSTSIAVYLLSWIYVIVAFAISWVIAYARDKYAAREHIYYRLVQFLIITLGIVVIVALLEFTSFRFMDIFTSLLAFIPTGWGMLLIAQVLRPFLQSTPLWGAVVSMARLYDIMFGVIVMAPVAFLSWMPGFQSMQTRILFNEAFSRGLRIFQILTGKNLRLMCDLR